MPTISSHMITESTFASAATVWPTLAYVCDRRMAVLAQRSLSKNRGDEVLQFVFQPRDAMREATVIIKRSISLALQARRGGLPTHKCPKRVGGKQTPCEPLFCGGVPEARRLLRYRRVGCALEVHVPSAFPVPFSFPHLPFSSDLWNISTFPLPRSRRALRRLSQHT
ncbi:hypothetical protein GY45DRAFT_912526 [Cubamyces sp. BRFM 1775]|nr:hypothetical protein GY45DRAFT_912526 [Cubamyces sp. BRFM 1775]